MLKHAQNLDSRVESVLNILCRQIPVQSTFDPDYVPVQCARHANSEPEDFDLDQYVDEFLAGMRKVLLILGDSGAGKSLYTQYLVHRLWQGYSVASNKHPLPLLISLPRLKDPINNAIEETLLNYGLQQEQILELKQNQSFIFILDAYDEIRQNKNLFVTNRLGEWTAKVLITCRTQYLFTLEHYDSYFMPYQGEKRQSELFSEVYIKPFNQNQIEKYLQQYVQYHKTEWNDWQIYQKHLEAIQGLKKLIQTPFLLKLAVEAMPELIKQYQLQDEKKSGKQEEDQKINQNQNQLKITQAKLYDIFVAHWFDRQEQKLKEANLIKSEEDIKPKLWAYAKSLAKELHQRNLVQVIYETSEDLFGENETENPWHQFFDEHDNQIQILRTANLLQITGKYQYTFFHSSLIEYFVTRGLYEASTPNVPFKSNLKSESKPGLNLKKEGKQEIEADQIFQIPEAWFNNYFNQRLIVEERNTLQFLADRVAEDESFKQYLFDLVEASKQTERIQIAAANAITVLNASEGVPLCSKDFKNIKIPHADLSGAILWGSDFSGADLSGVNLQSCNLRRAKLSQAQMTGVQFGERPLIGLRENAESCAFSQDWKLMAVTVNAYKKKDIEIYGVENQQVLKLLKGHTKSANCVAFSVGGELASGGEDNTIRIWDVAKGKQLRCLKGHTDAVMSIAIDGLGENLASGSRDKTIRLWNIVTGKALKRFKGHTGYVRSVVFDSTGKKLASGSNDSTIRIWDVLTGKQLKCLEGHTESVLSVAFDASGEKLASGSKDKTIRIWKTSTGNELSCLGSYGYHILCVAFDPRGERLAFGSADLTVRLWDVSAGKELRYFEGHVYKGERWHLDKVKFNKDPVWAKPLGVKCIAFDKFGERLASLGSDETVRLWDVAATQELKRFEGHTKNVVKVVFDPRGEKIASGSSDKTIRIWSVATGRQLICLEGHAERVQSIVFDPKGEKLASGSSDNSIRLWNVNTGKELRRLEKHTSDVMCIVFDPSGEKLASGSWDETIRIWNANTGEELKCLKGHTRAVINIIFNSPGEKLISGSLDHTIRIWDVVTGKEMACHNGDANDSSEYNVAFDSSGEKFAWKSPIQIRNIVTGKELSCLSITGITCAAFNSLGEKLAVAQDGLDSASRISLWDVTTGEWLSHEFFEYKVFSLSWWQNRAQDYLAVGFRNFVACFQVKDLEEGLKLRLDWISTGSPALSLTDAYINDVQGLDANNWILMRQSSAKSVPYYESLLESTRQHFPKQEAAQTLKSKQATEQSSQQEISDQSSQQLSNSIKEDPVAAKSKSQDKSFKSLIARFKKGQASLQEPAAKQKPTSTKSDQTQAKEFGNK